MKTFDIHRFWLTMKWDLRSNIRYNVRHWLIMLTLFFFAILLPHACVITQGDKTDGQPLVESVTEDIYNELTPSEQSEWTRGEDIIDEEGRSVATFERMMPPRVEKWAERVETQHIVCAAFLILIVAFYFTFSASLFLNNMTTKQKRITFLALPASRSEKLLARWVYAVPVWLLMVLSAFIAADLLRFAVQPIIGPYHPGLMITWLWENAGNWFADVNSTWGGMQPQDRSLFVAMIVGLCTNLLLTHSTYILGSALFPRFPWMVATGVMCAFSSIVSIAMFAVGGEAVSDIVDRFDNKDLTFTYTLSGIQTFLSILFYILAVRVFRRTQVIHHKLVNL